MLETCGQHGWRGDGCSMLTLQQPFDVAELALVVEFPEVLGLLCELFALGERVSLVCDEV